MTFWKLKEGYYSLALLGFSIVTRREDDLGIEEKFLFGDIFGLISAESDLNPCKNSLSLHTS